MTPLGTVKVPEASKIVSQTTDNQASKSFFDFEIVNIALPKTETPQPKIEPIIEQFVQRIEAPIVEKIAEIIPVVQCQETGRGNDANKVGLSG